MLLSLFLQIGLLAAPTMAGPVVCTTTLEAPDPQADGSAPVQLTRCEPVERTSEFLERRYSTWNAPFDSGVNVLHQVTDLLGIAVGGTDGTRFMGFGFPDQTVIWDGTVMRNSIDALMEAQSPPIPWRSTDIPSGLDGSLTQRNAPARPVVEVAPVQPLW